MPISSVMSKEAHVNGLIHELADTVVNWGGYASDKIEAEERHRARDALVVLLRETIDNWEAGT